MSQWFRCLLRLAMLVCVATAGLTYADAVPGGGPNLWDQSDGGAVVRSAYERYGREGEFIVQGTERADGSFHVRVLNLSGTTVFQSRFPVLEADGEPHVRWTYQDGLEMVEKSARPNPAEAPRLER